VPAKKNRIDPATLTGTKLIKEVNRRIRVAMRLWDAHKNAACRNERLRALELYDRLSDAERKQVPEQLRVWLRFRSEKYFGTTKSGGNGAHEKVRKKSRKPSGKTRDTPDSGEQTDDSNDEWAGVGL